MMGCRKMLDQQHISPATLQAAKDAVKTMIAHGDCMADSGSADIFFCEAHGISRRAKMRGESISPADWVYLATLADNVCDDDGLPRLFDVGA